MDPHDIWVVEAGSELDFSLEVAKARSVICHISALTGTGREQDLDGQRFALLAARGVDCSKAARAQDIFQGEAARLDPYEHCGLKPRMQPGLQFAYPLSCELFLGAIKTRLHMIAAVRCRDYCIMPVQVSLKEVIDPFLGFG